MLRDELQLQIIFNRSTFHIANDKKSIQIRRFPPTVYTIRGRGEGRHVLVDLSLDDVGVGVGVEVYVGLPYLVRLTFNNET